MPQLLFHGKQTVPSGLRRDVWRPYFSIHFPSNDAGKRIGLQAYQRLVELSRRRQLDPDPKTLITTQKDVDGAMKFGGDPIEIREMFKSIEEKTKRGEKLPKWKKRLDLPTVGQVLPLKYRARKLMNQKATAVADVAFVLELSMKPLHKLRLDAAKDLERRTAYRLKQLGERARKTLRFRRAKEEENSRQITERQELVTTAGMKPGSMSLDPKAAGEIAREFDGVVKDNKRLADINEFSEERLSKDEPSTRSIKVLWADIRDGTYAPSWADGILHGELQPLAVPSIGTKTVKVPAGNGIVKTMLHPVIRGPANKSVHVHGRATQPWYTTFQDAISKISNWQNTKHQSEIDADEQERATQRLITLYEEWQLREHAAFGARAKEEAGQILEPSDREAIDEANKVDSQWLESERIYPEAATRAEETVLFRQVMMEYVSIQNATKFETVGAPDQVAASSSGTSSQTPHSTDDSPRTSSSSSLYDLQNSHPTRFMAAREFLEQQSHHQQTIERINREIIESFKSPTSEFIDMVRGGDSVVKTINNSKRRGELRKSLRSEQIRLKELEGKIISRLLGGGGAAASRAGGQQAEGARRQEGESDAEYLKRTQGVVVEESRGIWGRLRGLFGRN